MVSRRQYCDHRRGLYGSRCVVVLAITALHAFGAPCKAEEGSAHIKVIGAGFAHTETLSAALTMLDFGPVYGTEEVILNRNLEEAHSRMWMDHADGVRKMDWNALLGNYSSVVGFPAAPFYKELLEAFPDAKIILPTADLRQLARNLSAGRFAFETHWTARFMALLVPSLGRELDVADRSQGSVLGHFKGGRPVAADEEDRAVAAYRRWAEQVAAAVPPAQLLAWDVREGWGPLCTFLGVPVPAGPLPVRDGRAGWEWRRMQWQAAAYGTLFLPALSALALGWLTGHWFGYRAARNHYRPKAPAAARKTQ